MSVITVLTLSEQEKNTLFLGCSAQKIKQPSISVCVNDVAGVLTCVHASG